MVYEMLTGRNPFQGETAHDVFSLALKSDPPPMGVGRDVELVVRRGLSKSNRQRFPTITDFSGALGPPPPAGCAKPSGQRRWRMPPARSPTMTAKGGRGDALGGGAGRGGGGVRLARVYRRRRGESPLLPRPRLIANQAGGDHPAAQGAAGPPRSRAAPRRRRPGRPDATSRQRSGRGHCRACTPDRPHQTVAACPLDLPAGASAPAGFRVAFSG